mmetsp:Transcript_70989/g.199208  ORF Transcript_70989/g.199208 Transcript_70989/m.199208 type:complete len:86 (-) Transcript_70989:993-1250(-)
MGFGWSKVGGDWWVVRSGWYHEWWISKMVPNNFSVLFHYHVDDLRAVLVTSNKRRLSTPPLDASARDDQEYLARTAEARRVRGAL